LNQYNNFSKLLQPKPIPAGKSVSYQLIGAGEPHPLTKKPQYKASHDIFGQEMIHDPGDENNRSKELLYVQGTRKKADGSMEPIIGTIEFGGKAVKNIYTVTSREENAYLYLERSNYNASNEHRDPNVTPLFYRMDPEGAAEAANLKEEKELEARHIVKNMPVDDLIAYAKALTQIDNVNVSEAMLRQKMRAIAIANPEQFIKGSGSKLSKAKADAFDALEERILAYNHTTREWSWAKEKTLITTTPEGMEHREHFAEYLLTDKNGISVYEQVLKQLRPQEASNAKKKN
jgi:hypothetical protein